MKFAGRSCSTCAVCVARLPVCARSSAPSKLSFPRFTLSHDFGRGLVLRCGYTLMDEAYGHCFVYFYLENRDRGDCKAADAEAACLQRRARTGVALSRLS